jgi:hypothetical protein
MFVVNNYLARAFSSTCAVRIRSSLPEISVDDPGSIRLLSWLNIRGVVMAQQNEYDLKSYSEKLEQIRGYL